MTLVTDAVAPRAPGRPDRRLSSRQLMWIGLLVGAVVMSAGRLLADTDNLTSDGTFAVMLRTGAPLAMAGLAGLYAERSGTINIGLEGMMTLGTIFAGWWGWHWGPWMALLGGMLGGLLGGLLHALATATFGVNHIVSGFAINIIAPGVTRFMAGLLFVDGNGQGIDGGSISNSPGMSSPMGQFTLPFVSGGNIGSWTSPDPLGWLGDKHWFLISDVAGLVRGLTAEVSLDIVLVVVMFVVSVYVLWHTPFGLRLRSAGERPAAADSLGVPVVRYRYYGMAISGALAGFGGAILVLFANRYQENQVSGRGYLGLASLVIGNWRPAGVAIGAGLFGYFQGIQRRTGPETLVLGLVLVAAIGLVVAAVWLATRINRAAGGALAALGVAGLVVHLLTADFTGSDLEVAVTRVVLTAAAVTTLGLVVWASSTAEADMASWGFDTARVGAALLLAAGGVVVFVQADRPNNQFVYVMPYVVTLIVISAWGQALRPPAQAGVPWRKGMQV